MKLLKVGALVPFALTLAACASSPGPEAGTPPPEVEARLVQAHLETVPVYVEAGGVVRARTTASISSRVLAPIVAVAVAPGDRVRQGQLLVQLDSRELDANEARASASLLAAEQAVAAAEGGRQSAEASLDLAAATYARIAVLRDRRSATPQEFDKAAADQRAAEGQLAAAMAQAAQAAAALEAARAGAEAARVAASYARLTAPFDGVVTTRAVDQGSVATPGVPLLTIEDTGASRLEVRVDEARAGLVAVGNEAEVRFDREGRDAASWTTARVAEVARIDPESHSFVVKIDLPGASAVPSGSFGRARFAGSPRRTLIAPASVLVRRGQLTFVFAVDGEVARLRPVDAGPVVDDRVELLAGVRDGETLVAEPPLALTDGSRVRPSVQGGSR